MKLIITEEEKKEIIGQYYSNHLINEQFAFKNILKFFGGSKYNEIVDLFSKGGFYGSAKTLDDSLLPLFKSGNLLSKGTRFKGPVIVTSLGQEVDAKLIQDIIQLGVSGRLNARQLYEALPETLASGDSFRDLVIQAISQSINSSIKK